MNFFDTVRGLKPVEETTQQHGNLLVEKDAAAALNARRQSNDAHAISQTAHYHGGSHAQAAAAHAFAYEAHRKLAKQSDKHAAAYHKAMADHHSLMSDIHNAANPNGLKLDQ